MCNTPRILKLLVLVLVSIAGFLSISMSLISTAALELGRAIGLFENYNTSLVWSERNTFENGTITPIGWTFSVWGPIYVFNVMIVVYWWTLACRRAYTDGPFLCEEPDLLPMFQLVWYFFSFAFNMAWIVMVDRADAYPIMQVPMSAVLFAVTVCLYLTLICSHYALFKEKERILKAGKRTDYWLVVGIVHNGLSMYATWVTIASFLNLNTALIYIGGINNITASIGCLSGVIIIVLIYAIADLTVIDIVTRYVFTPHLVVLWACAGSLVRNFVAWSTTSIMTVALMCAVAVALLLKLVLICVRRRSQPVLKDSVYDFEK